MEKQTLLLLKMNSRMEVYLNRIVEMQVTILGHQTSMTASEVSEFLDQLRSEISEEFDQHSEKMLDAFLNPSPSDTA